MFNYVVTEATVEIPDLYINPFDTERELENMLYDKIEGTPGTSRRFKTLEDAMEAAKGFASVKYTDAPSPSWTCQASIVYEDNPEVSYVATISIPELRTLVERIQKKLQELYW